MFCIHHSRRRAQAHYLQTSSAGPVQLSKLERHAEHTVMFPRLQMSTTEPYCRFLTLCRELVVLRLLVLTAVLHVVWRISHHKSLQTLELTIQHLQLFALLKSGHFQPTQRKHRIQEHSKRCTRLRWKVDRRGRLNFVNELCLSPPLPLYQPLWTTWSPAHHLLPPECPIRS